MKKITIVSIFALFISSSVAHAQKGLILARPLGNIDITIDGDISDWPLDQFQQVAEHELFPDTAFSDSSPASGDHIVYDPDRVGFFNTPRGAVAEDDPNTDFEVTTYFAHDDDFLYILGVFVDDEIEDTRDESPEGSQPFFNDGMEFFFDTNNEDDCGFDNAGDPNLGVFQISSGLNLFFDPVIPEDEGGLGTVMGIERSENEDLFGGLKFVDSLFSITLEETEGEDIAARKYDDLRAAGALNSVITDNPTVNFAGYAYEVRIPFGFYEEFTKKTMRFDVFWRDVDFADNSIQFIDWAQNTTVACNDGEVLDRLFHTANWAELRFEGDPLDGSGAGVNDWSIR